MSDLHRRVERLEAMLPAQPASPPDNLPALSFQAVLEGMKRGGSPGTAAPSRADLVQLDFDAVNEKRRALDAERIGEER